VSLLYHYAMGDKTIGKLVVIEGGDGSGKTTQSVLLLEYLKHKDIPHSSLDFPQYNTFYGKMVAQFLRGEFGKLSDVSPYLASLTYALDRFAVRDQIKAKLDRGEVLIANRYVTSNIAHQGARIPEGPAREAFIDWLSELEYELHKLPREDLVLYLQVPSEVTEKLSGMKETRSYLQGHEDIQENDRTHRDSSTMMYNILSERYKHWETIKCFRNDTMISQEEIHNAIVQTLVKKGIVK